MSIFSFQVKPLKISENIRKNIGLNIAKTNTFENVANLLPRTGTAQKMKKSLMEKLIFCAVRQVFRGPMDSETYLEPCKTVAVGV